MVHGVAVMEQTGQQIRDLALVLVPDDPRDAGERGEFLRSALGIAASHENAAAGILAVRAAHGLSHIVIGRRGDGAGIENHEVRLATVRRAYETARGKLRFERCAIGLRSAAAEILNEEAGHLYLM
jgi:hypothetical protein